MGAIAIRIMKVVDAVGGNMSEFARKIDVTPAYISKMGKQPEKCRPSKLIINRICHEFHVDEDWLINGTGGDGPIFIEPATFSLDQYAKDRGASPLELAIAKAYFDLPQDVRSQILEKFKSVFKEDTEATTKSKGVDEIDEGENRLVSFPSSEVPAEKEQRPLHQAAAIKNSSVQAERISADDVPDDDVSLP